MLFPFCRNFEKYTEQKKQSIMQPETQAKLDSVGVKKVGKGLGNRKCGR